MIYFMVIMISIKRLKALMFVLIWLGEMVLQKNSDSHINDIAKHYKFMKNIIELGLIHRN